MTISPNRRSLLTGSLALGAAAALATPAIAQGLTRLRIQTHLAETSIEGQSLARFADLVKQLSSGTLEIEMHYSSDIVAFDQAFDATRNGIIDGDWTSPTFITGKDPAFQFFGDLLGGYRNPFEFNSWVMYAGGRELADELYGSFDTHMVGLYWAGTESLAATKPLAGIADLKDWRFRCPPGMQTEIFTLLGAAPVVLAPAEVFTAMSTGVVDGADSGVLFINKQNGLYDIAKHATYPGFHSLAGNHLNIANRVWNNLSADHQQIIEVAHFYAMQRASIQYIQANTQAAAELKAAGVTLHVWSDEDLLAYNETAKGVWMDWATRSPMAARVVESHLSYLTDLGIISA